MSGFGSMLKDYLEYYKITQTEFADRLGITQKHMNEIINGKTKISQELMILISLLTNIDINLIFFAEYRKEVYDRLLNEYKTEKEIKKMLNSYSLKEMVDKNWIKLKHSSSFVQNYIDLIDYLNIKDLNTLDNYISKRYLFKKRDNADIKKIYLWIRHCDKITNHIKVNKYKSNNIDKLLKELEIIRLNKFNKKELIDLFNKYGIILYIEDALKGSKVRGCIKVMIDTPVIYMTTYYKEKSSFYFTLYHELVHLKKDYNKLKNKTIIDNDIEDDIDIEALEYMIPNNTYKEVLSNYDNKDIIAMNNNIPLCFLYSRLAKDGKISYSSKEYINNIEKID